MPHVVFVYTTTVQKTIGSTAFFRLYAGESQHPIDLFSRNFRSEVADVKTELSENLYEVDSHAQMTMGKEQRRQKE